MFTYVFALLAIVLFFYEPLTQLISPGPAQIRRAPRPQINPDLLALEPHAPNGTAPDCASHWYNVHIFSKAPLVIYIENLLSKDERAHLLEIR